MDVCQALDVVHPAPDVTHGVDDVADILDLTRFNKIAIQGTPQMAVD